MKNIHVLPTDNYSPLVHSTNKYGGYFKSEHYSPMKEMGDSYQNIYITSDEEIKIGDWVYCLREGFEPVLKQKVNPIGVNNDEMMKKIILTTDQDLDGVQAIDDEFLEWFVNNPSCEEVEVNHFGMCCSNQLIAQCINCNQYNPVYKIIIPKEEPTISEEAKQRAKNYMSLKGALEPKDVVLGYKTSLDAKMLDSHYVNFSNPNADKITSNTTNKPIENRKTAMQQLINEIVEHLTYDDDLSDDSRMTLETIRLRCLGKLSIEKNQTLEFVSNAVRKILDEDRQNLFNLEQYYNETYKPE